MRAAVGEVEQDSLTPHGKKELEKLLPLLIDLNVVLRSAGGRSGY